MAGQLEQWINDLIDERGGDLFRYKGVMAVKGMDKKFIFQGVGMLFSQVALSYVDSHHHASDLYYEHCTRTRSDCSCPLLRTLYTDSF